MVMCDLLEIFLQAVDLVSVFDRDPDQATKEQRGESQPELVVVSGHGLIGR